MAVPAFRPQPDHLRAFQNDGAPIPAGQGDEAQPPRANHNGSVIRFGPDRKLYILIGDKGRRGSRFEGDLFVAAARPFLEGGHLFHFNLTGNRRAIRTDDFRLEDRVADNLHKWEITESESLLIGRNFGVGTDMHTGPNGNLFIVSLTNGAIYEIFRARRDPQ